MMELTQKLSGIKNLGLFICKFNYYKKKTDEQILEYWILLDSPHRIKHWRNRGK